MSDERIQAVDSNGDTVFRIDGVNNFYRGGPTIAVSDADPIVVTGEDGRALLRIRRDGTVDGVVEDASEAARIFVREVRRLAALVDWRRL